MSEVLKRRMRCVVYTRKSSEEGLEQEYNSIDAQRDAGHAYITSQRAEGWIAVTDDYDDPAFSGGNMERPALRRLMTDIEAGKIDVVVIYKIDRLTRSLTDFSRMVEVFERYGVSFVSVTQQFNATTSMGRLMLNILLSFVQFEREVTGERIRDKITASKKKGMWMGGIPPLGYDVHNRRLVQNSKEAKLIRHIFQRFVEMGSSTTLVRELKLDGVTSKVWTTQGGKVRMGTPIDKSLIYKLLNNRTYLGELRHKEQWYQAEHIAIIDAKLWGDAQAILASNGRVRGNTTRGTVPFLLKGIVFGNDGRALSPWYTTKKNGHRYRYYLPQRDAKEYAGASGLPRLPAAQLEAAVLEQLRAILRQPALIAEIVPQAIALNNELDEAQITVAMTRLDTIWDQLFPAEQSRIVRLLLEKVIVSPTNMELRLRANGIEQVVMELQPARAARVEREEGVGMNEININRIGVTDIIPSSDGRLTLIIPIKIRRRGSNKVITLPNGETGKPQKPLEPAPMRLALARGHRWLAMLESGEVKSLTEIAKREGVNNSYVSRMVNLTTLAPDIVAAILNDALSDSITLLELAADPPVLWEERLSGQYLAGTDGQFSAGSNRRVADQAFCGLPRLKVTVRDCE